MTEKIPLDEVLNVIPLRLFGCLSGLTRTQKISVEELRLRCGFPMTALLPEGEVKCGDTIVTGNDLREMLDRATHSSVHTALEQVRRGFVTIKGGHRIGLCGTVARKDGDTVSMRYLSSASIRVARAIEGQAGELVARLFEGGVFQSTLLLGSPGTGKTTLLRDMLRVISDEYRCRVGVVDERGEIAAMWQGEPQFYVGRYTDVMDGSPKSEGMSMLLRGMNPQVLAADEITQIDDVRAITDAAGCGVSLLATAHGSSMEDLQRRPIYRELLAACVFRRVVLLGQEGARRWCRVEVIS